MSAQAVAVAISKVAIKAEERSGVFIESFSAEIRKPLPCRIGTPRASRACGPIASCGEINGAPPEWPNRGKIHCRGGWRPGRRREVIPATEVGTEDSRPPHEPLAPERRNASCDSELADAKGLWTLIDAPRVARATRFDDKEFCMIHILSSCLRKLYIVAGGSGCQWGAGKHLCVHL